MKLNKSANKFAVEYSSEIFGMSPVLLVTPVNIVEEKKKWITLATKGRFTNPTFIYDTYILNKYISYGERIEKFKNLLFDEIIIENKTDEILLELLEKRIVESLRTAKIAENIKKGDDLSSGVEFRKKYGFPNKSQIEKCRLLSDELKLNDINKIKHDVLKDDKIYNADDIVSVFNQVINKYGFYPCKCEVNGRVTAITVDERNASGYPYIYVPIERQVDFRTLCKLVGHEIECHLRNSINSRCLLYNLLDNDKKYESIVSLISKSDDEMLYEGLAKRSDVLIGGNSSLPMPWYTLAIDFALASNSFLETAEYIYEILMQTDLKEADNYNILSKTWTITYRVFRGIDDTKNKYGYAFTKDYVYWAGYNMIENVPERYLNYASMTESELKLLENSGVDLRNAKYKNKNIGKMILDNGNFDI